jgi:hypothetical protein
VGSRSPGSGFQDAQQQFGVGLPLIGAIAHTQQVGVPEQLVGKAARRGGLNVQPSHEGEAVLPARQHLTIQDCRMLWVACGVAVKRERSGQCRSPLAARARTLPISENRWTAPMAASGESCRDNGHGFSSLDDPGCVKTLRGINAPGILRLVVTISAKKRKNSSSARCHDQIRFRFHTAWTRRRRGSSPKGPMRRI